MALADEDHLRAVYYLHRASAAGRPFPVAPGNLKLEFEKILKMKPHEAAAVSDMSNETLAVLENRFLEFHANCHTRPGEFLTYQEKSSQILQLVQVGFEEIGDRSLDKTMQKMCLISIAAEYLAWRGTSHDYLGTIGVAEKKRDEEHQRNCQAFYLLQRFNIETFSALLKMLARELDTKLAGGLVNASSDGSEAPLSAIPRILPNLRQYSSWLLSNIKSVIDPRHASTQKCAERFWKIYVQALNLLLKAYPIRTIPEVNHLLEEDEDTLAFAPFSDKVCGWRYKAEDGAMKAAFNATLSVQRPTEEESQFRAREFVVDALRLSNAKADFGIDWSPLTLGDAGFEYLPKPEVQAPEPVSKPPSQPFRVRAHIHARSASELPLDTPPRPKNISVNGMNGQKLREMVTDEAAMANIVDELVNTAPIKVQEPQQPSSSFTASSIVTGTPRQQPGPISVTDLVGRMLQKPATSESPQESGSRVNKPALASIFATPFTPRPEASASLSPRLAAVFPSGSPSASAQQFQQHLIQQEQEIQARSSPLPRHQFTSPSHAQSPRMHSTFGQVNSSLSGSWASPPTRSPNQQARQLPQAALFGAIGEPRRSGSRTPMSGHSG